MEAADDQVGLPDSAGLSQGTVVRAVAAIRGLLEHRVGDLADRLPRYFGAYRGGQMMLDIADRHAAGVEADDH